MQHYLVVCTLTENSSDIIREFSKLPNTAGCSIVDSRFNALGQEVSIMLFLSGTWDAIVKVEDLLRKYEQEHDLQILIKRTTLENLKGNSMPYAIDVVGVDQPGVLFEIADFMSTNNLIIEDMTSNNYQASHTGAAMFALHMTVNIPIDASIAAIRSEFIDFCDRLNLDAIMEPIK